MTAPEPTIVRTGTAKDLEDLVRLEATFGDDQFPREQIQYLLTKANSTTLILEHEHTVCGSAIMLWRAGSTASRLFSIVIDPGYQGRGFGRKLLEACEEIALQHNCRSLALEVRADNKPAIGLYKAFGYRISGDLPGYYADGSSGLRMVKELPLAKESAVRLQIPYYAQTLSFTCGPASLMMALGYFNRELELNRSLELKLWKEATLIFMTSGLGGCPPFGLAVAAQRRGLSATVIVSSHRTPFLSSTRGKDKKEVIQLVHEQLVEEADRLGVLAEYRAFRTEDIVAALNRNAVPIVLISSYRLHKVRVPHWVVVTGVDRHHVYIHDPNEGFYLEDVRTAQNVRIPLAEFRRMHGWGSDMMKSVVFIEKATEDVSQAFEGQG
jgi:ribosomal protein S18 acetylase RimI-like enzyme